MCCCSLVSRAYYSDESTFIEDAMIHLYDFAEDLNLSKI
jgi:hypothetical protein